MTHMGTHIYITSILLFFLLLTLLPFFLAGQLAQTLPFSEYHYTCTKSFALYVNVFDKCQHCKYCGRIKLDL
jgi:hypothetical protein